MTTGSKSIITQSIKGALKTISSFNVDFLTDESDGIYGFNFRKHEISKILSSSELLLKRFHTNYSVFLEQSDQSLDKISQSLELIIDTFNKMKAFIDKQNKSIGLSPNDDGYEHVDLSQQQDRLSQELDNAHNQFDIYVTPLVKQIEANEEIQELSSRKEEDAVLKYADLFERRITAHGDTATYWLLCLLFLISAASVYIVLEISHYSERRVAFTNTLDFLEFISLRAFFLYLIGYMIYFLSKGYRLNKNQQIIYEDKKIALDTYDFFAASNRYKDQDLHRIIMLQVTNAIFQTHSNGYVDDSKEPSFNNLNVGDALVALSKMSGNKTSL